MTDDANHLAIWTVYKSPRDYPGLYVARKSRVAKSIVVTSEVLTSKTLDDLREQLPPGLFCLPRQEADDPVIVEVWL